MFGNRLLALNRPGQVVHSKREMADSHTGPLDCFNAARHNPRCAAANIADRGSNILTLSRHAFSL